MSTMYDEDTGKDIELIKLDTKGCWADLGGTFMNVQNSKKELPSGYYRAVQTNQGPVAKAMDVKTDELIVNKDSLSYEIEQEIHQFWARRERYERVKILHRRGYLLHGDPGTGKTCLVCLIAQKCIDADGVVFTCAANTSGIEALTSFLQIFRKTEPERPVIVMFEDFEKHVRYAEQEILAFLDGEIKIDHIVCIATTNHLDQLPARIQKRPRRFDRVIQIGNPDDAMKREYLASKFQTLPEINNTETIDKIISVTENFSFAALTELVVQVVCFEYTIESAAEKLKTLLDIKPKNDNVENDADECDEDEDDD